MPPPAVKTIRDLLFWQYSKIISESAGIGKKNYGFIMDRFKKHGFMAVEVIDMWKEDRHVYYATFVVKPS